MQHRYESLKRRSHARKEELNDDPVATTKFIIGQHGRV